MNRIALLVAGLLCLAFLVLLSPFILHPTLYTIGNDSSTPSQANPAALEQLSQEKSGELYGQMQDLLDAPQAIVLNIRIRDFEEAERAFEEYKEHSRSFDNLVVSLELDESAVGDFRRENRKNMAALERMINESARFEEINRLEVRYRSEENPSLVYTVIYEGEEVHQALEKTSGEFWNRTPEMLEVSEELGLNTTRYQEAVEELRELVEADRARQDQRAADQPALSPARITISVVPDTGRYGDVLQVRGAYIFMRLPEVVLFLDSREWKTVVPDENGIFVTSLPIGRIRPGTHLLFARSGSLNSNIVSFSVEPVATTLSLDTETGGLWDEVLCHGTLVAGEVPVSGAPVVVRADGVEVLQATTEPNGTYEVSLTLPEGEHVLQAVFEAEGYPLNPSESEARMVTLSPEAGIPLTALAVLGFTFLSALGAVWYIRWRGAVPGVAEKETPREVLTTVDEQTPSLPDPVDVLISYQELNASGNPAEAVLALYRSLTGRLFPGAVLLAKTPRELLADLSGSPAAGLFASFVGRYEEVRYGALPLRPQDPILTHWNAVISLLEEAAV
jgi:hypothetical protein